MTNNILTSNIHTIYVIEGSKNISVVIITTDIQIIGIFKVYERHQWSMGAYSFQVLVVGYEYASMDSEPDEMIENSILGSKNGKNYMSWFNVTFWNGTTGIICFGILREVLVIVILGFFLYCCGSCCPSRRKMRNVNLNKD